jgi:hypothetical protein
MPRKCNGSTELILKRLGDPTILRSFEPARIRGIGIKDPSPGESLEGDLAGDRELRFADAERGEVLLSALSDKTESAKFDTIVLKRF